MRRLYCLKRVFKIYIETCPKCGGAVKIISCIEDPAVMDKILRHLDKQAYRLTRCYYRNPGGRRKRVYSIDFPYHPSRM